MTQSQQSNNATTGITAGIAWVIVGLMIWGAIAVIHSGANPPPQVHTTYETVSPEQVAAALQPEYHYHHGHHRER